MEKHTIDDTKIDQPDLSSVQPEINKDNVLSSPDVKKQEESEINWKSFLLETLQTIVLALILYFLIDTFVARVRVDNVSMKPTLQPGEFLLVDRKLFKINDLKVGDVVVFHFPLNPEEDYIKRVIGLSGDQVTISQGEVYVNGNMLTEPYLNAKTPYDGEWTVPDDAIFVLGDNRDESYDSHSWGFVPDENVIGRAFFIYWPINEIELLK